MPPKDFLTARLSEFLEPYGFQSITSGLYKKGMDTGEQIISFSTTTYPDGLMVDCFSGFRNTKVEEMIAPYTELPNTHSSSTKITLLLPFIHIANIFQGRVLVNGEAKTLELLDKIYDALELYIFRWLDSLNDVRTLEKEMEKFTSVVPNGFHHALRHLALLQLLRYAHLKEKAEYYRNKVNSDIRLSRHSEPFQKFIEELLLRSK